MSTSTNPPRKRYYRKKKKKPQQPQPITLRPSASASPIDPFREYLLARVEAKLQEWCALRPLSMFADVPAQETQRTQFETLFAGAPAFLAHMDDICAVHPVDSALFTAVLEKLNHAQNIYRNFCSDETLSHNLFTLPWKKTDDDSLVLYSEELDSFVCVPMVKLASDKMLAFQLTHAAKQKIVSRFIRDHLLEADQMLLAAKNAIQREAQQEFEAAVTGIVAETPTAVSLETIL